MTDEDLCFTSAAELARLIRGREVSPVEVTQAVIDRIERFDGRVNAFSRFAPDMAMRMARDAEAAVMAGDPLGPLHGVPVTIKDLFDLEGFVTESGSRTQAWATGKQAAGADSPVAARLKAAGAVILGKTTTPEFGWTGVSRSPLTGITHNPWKHGYNAGASSSGAGAAAAAGFGPLHQGSDGAGSIRMPAHFSGAFGIKPTWGRVPHVPVRNNDLVSHVGPLSRTVEDAALFLNATAGAHPLDHTSLTEPVPDFLENLSRDVTGLRIAFSPNLGHARVDAEVATLVAAAARIFESAGCTVEEVTPEWGPLGPELGRFFWSVPRSASSAIPGRLGIPNGPRPGRLHPSRHRPLRRRLPGHASPQTRLHRTPKRLHGRLGPAPNPVRIRPRLPSNKPPTRTLAPTPLGLALLGRILLPLQHERPPRRQLPLRLDRIRPPSRPPNHRPPRRRLQGPPSRRHLRTRPTLGQPPPLVCPLATSVADGPLGRGQDALPPKARHVFHQKGVMRDATPPVRPSRFLEGLWREGILPSLRAARRVIRARGQRA